ncbi:MAG: hypothetical protein VX438_16205, partial [Planctomycetota bacterium]|nr:hypothetical protein [Planctomycetota bacterium]
MSQQSPRCIQCSNGKSLGKVVWFVFMVLPTGFNEAQIVRNNRLPKAEYYTGKQAFYADNFRIAEKLFRSSSSGYKRGTA